MNGTLTATAVWVVVIIKPSRPKPPSIKPSTEFSPCGAADDASNTALGDPFVQTGFPRDDSGPAAAVAAAMEERALVLLPAMPLLVADGDIGVDADEDMPTTGADRPAARSVPSLLSCIC